MASPVRPREVFRPFFSAGWLDGWMVTHARGTNERKRREESNNETTQHETNEPLTAAEKAEDERQGGHRPPAPLPHPPPLALHFPISALLRFKRAWLFSFPMILFAPTEFGLLLFFPFRCNAGWFPALHPPPRSRARESRARRWGRFCTTDEGACFSRTA